MHIQPGLDGDIRRGTKYCVLRFSVHHFNMNIPSYRWNQYNHSLLRFLVVYITVELHSYCRSRIMIKNRFFDKSWGDRTSWEEAWFHSQVFDCRLTRWETGFFFLLGFFFTEHLRTRAGWAKVLLRTKYTEIETPCQRLQMKQMCHHDYTY